MCRLRYYSLSHKLGWRLAGVTALFFFLLGAISFGYGIKLLEYAEKKDITPIFAAVPMLLSGVLGAGVVLSKKKCAVACYAIMSVIVMMLSVHMNYRFMVKEYSSIPLYRTQCQTEPDRNQHYCQQYSGTVMLCCVSVSMIPVAIGAVLSCLVALKTLRKKNIYLPWFTFSKVEPAETNRKTRVIKKNNKIITLVNYKQSSGRVGEIPETRPSDEYIPDIPDFMELAIPSSTNPAYRASVMVQNEETNEYGASTIKNVHSKSLNDLEERNPREKPCVKGGEKSYSNDLLVNKDALDKRRRKKRLDKQVLASSDVDLRFVDQDFFNRNKNHENVEYYDSAAEDWIQKLVDSAQNSRNRLYGVSDEEDLDSDSELLSTDSKPFLSKQNKATKLRQTVGLDNEDLSASVRLLSQNKANQDIISIEDTENKKDINLEFSGDTEKDTKSLSQEENQNLGFSRRKRINAASSPGDLEQGIDDNKHELDQTSILFNDGRMFDHTTTIKSDVVENFSKDLTPPGLITPLHAGHSSPGGQLHFEFDKLPNTNSDRQEVDELPRMATTEHAHWMEFEGEADRKKLIKGKMPESEYSALTSYVM